MRKGENVWTSEIAKQLLESAREDRLELMDLLARPGEPFSLHHPSDVVRVHVDAAKIGKRGACHLFRPHHGDADA